MDKQTIIEEIKACFIQIEKERPNSFFSLVLQKGNERMYQAELYRYFNLHEDEQFHENAAIEYPIGKRLRIDVALFSGEDYHFCKENIACIIELKHYGLQQNEDELEKLAANLKEHHWKTRNIQLVHDSSLKEGVPMIYIHVLFELSGIEGEEPLSDLEIARFSTILTYFGNTDKKVRDKLTFQKKENEPEWLRQLNMGVPISKILKNDNFDYFKISHSNLHRFKMNVHFIIYSELTCKNDIEYELLLDQRENEQKAKKVKN
jgi:hypothetical protein